MSTVKYIQGILLITLFMCYSSAWSTPFSYSGTSAIDVDTFAGTNHTINVGTSGIITDLNVSVELGGSPQWQDLDISLIFNGTSVALISETLNPFCCSGSAAFNATFDDEAVQTVASVGLGALVGTFQPEFGSLSVYDGMNIAGVWTLNITEIFCCQNETDLVSWSISGNTSTVPEPATLVLMSLGLAGIGYRRKKAA